MRYVQLHGFYVGVRLRCCFLGLCRVLLGDLCEECRVLEHSSRAYEIYMGPHEV